MLDLGWQEFFLIATIAVVVVGPKDLPRVIRTVTKFIRKARSMARDFQSSIEEVAREAELDDVRREAQKLANQDLSKSILGTVDPDGDLKKTLEETRSSVEDTEIPSPASPGTADPSAAEMEIQDADAREPDASAVVGGEPAPLIKPPSLGTAKSAAVPSKETADDTQTVKKPRAARKSKPKADPKPARKAAPAAKPASSPRKKRAGSAKPAAVTKTAKTPKASNAKSATPSGAKSATPSGKER